MTVALIVKLVVGTTLLLPRGFDPRYYANAELAGVIERGVEPASESYTRIDRRLRFGAYFAPDLPLHFLNDTERFNRLRVPADGVQRLYVRTGGGARVTVSVGDASVATIPVAATLWSGDVAMPAGFESIE